MKMKANGRQIFPPSTRWMRFLAGLTVILLFAFGVIPGLQRLAPVRELRDAIRKSGIDATALFYTESDVSYEAETSIRNAIRYSVQRADCPAVPHRHARGESPSQ